MILNKRYQKIKKNTALTLPEVVLSVALTVFVFGALLGAWYFTYKNWKVETVFTRLRTNLEIAIERIKEEVRLSSAVYMSFYPAEGASYEAISFPMATQDANGFYTLDAEGKIFWDRSVIYHVYSDPDTGDVELRRTEFIDNHDIIIDKDRRYTQLVRVVTNGDGSGGPNADSSTTKVIFKNLVTFTIESQSQLFDGYSATERRSDNVEFGTVRLESGWHDFTFTVTDKNDASSDYKIGFDTMSITPSGGQKEVETYTPQSSSGDSYSKKYAVGWGGNNYLEYNSDQTGDFVSFRLYYDLWKESNFENSIQDNTVITGNDLVLKLATPKEGGMSFWDATGQTGAEPVDYSGVLNNITIRNLLSNSSIEKNGQLARVKFLAGAGQDLYIDSAYLQERLSGDDAQGVAVQLFFSDPPVPIGEEESEDGGLSIGGTPGITPSSILIPAGYYVWSNWAEFPIDSTKDYFVTFYVSTSSSCTYWHGDGSTTNSYYRDGNYAQEAIWDNSTPSPDIYACEIAENWSGIGTVTSRIYDTAVSDPNYNQIAWDAFKPDGSEIVLKARSSDDTNMSGAADWENISGSSLNPHNLAIGAGRYVQFQAELSKSSNFGDYENYPWIDNIVIDWPGEAKMCEISGFFTQRPDYGMIKLTVDGQELVKGLKFTVNVYENFLNKRYNVSVSSEVEPRNTGK